MGSLSGLAFTPVAQISQHRFSIANVVDKGLVLNEAVAHNLGIPFPASLKAKAAP